MLGDAWHRRSGEGQDPQPPVFVVAKAIGSIFWPPRHGVWVPAFAGTTPYVLIASPPS